MYDLHLWLGIPGERRIWLEQFEGVGLILKNLSAYFPTIKVFVDGLTAYDGERIEVENNLEAFEKIAYGVSKALNGKLEFEENHTFKITSQQVDIKLKSLSGYDYRTKICYCAMCDIAISDVSTTALVPFHFCKKPGVGFYFCLAHYNDITKFSKEIPLFYGVAKENLKTTDIKSAFFANFHIPPEHIYNLAAQSLEDLAKQGKLKSYKDKELKCHRLPVPPVELYAKRYELEKKTKIKISPNKATKRLLKELSYQKQLLKIELLEQDLELKQLQIKQLKQTTKGTQVPTLDSQTLGAVVRVKNHLAYKLGQSIIFNSKSLKGYLRMPYVLSYITQIHKQEQKAFDTKLAQNPNLKLPPLESFSDYQEALKLKESLSYKLGSAFMQGYKNLWRGGLLKFWLFDSKKIVKEWKEKKDRK